MIKLCFPFTTEKIHALEVGGEVLISGVVFSEPGGGLKRINRTTL